MEKKIDKDIEEILTSIEFPGEGYKDVKRYLDNYDFTDHVMNIIEEKNVKAKKIIFWLVFTLLNIIFLYILGTNQFIKNEYFAFNNTLAMLYFLFLGISLFCGLIGLVIYIDTSRFHGIQHLQNDILYGINKAKKRFAGK